MTMRVEVQVAGRQLELSNLDKVFYPETGFTKGGVIDYYSRIAPVLLPHLRGRPLTLKRYPNGVRGSHFYEKRCPSHRPPWVHTADIWSRHNQADIPFCLADDLPTLVWAANLGNLELHTSLSYARKIEQPSMLVFDLDPGPPAGLVECARVALLLRRSFATWGMESFVKTSGSKGMQMYVPLNVPVTYAETKPFAKELAETLERIHPELVVSNMRKSLRKGKVLVDWSQNDAHKTTVCVYSLRAKERPTVSTPVHWDEVERAEQDRAPEGLVFEADDVLRRTEKDGDLFAPVLTMKQSLPKLH